jgi:hypothetical protein
MLEEVGKKRKGQGAMKKRLKGSKTKQREMSRSG